jgi:hypothetical protein
MVADTELSRHPPRPPQLVPSKSDVEKAREYKDQLAALAAPICELMTKAKSEGILMSYSLQPDATGRFFINMLSAVKEL